jgi:hypothetical protein
MVFILGIHLGNCVFHNRLIKTLYRVGRQDIISKCLWRQISERPPLLSSQLASTFSGKSLSSVIKYSSNCPSLSFFYRIHSFVTQLFHVVNSASPFPSRSPKMPTKTCGDTGFLGNGGPDSRHRLRPGVSPPSPTDCGPPITISDLKQNFPNPNCDLLREGRYSRGGDAAYFLFDRGWGGPRGRHQ